MATTLVNPFDLLGVSVDTSVDDLRKSYYRLARLCHPDKGGTKDDMATLHHAYCWLKEQLGHRLPDDHLDMDALESSFRTFMELQSERNGPIKMDDVEWEAFGVSSESALTMCDGDPFLAQVVKTELRRKAEMGDMPTASDIAGVIETTKTAIAHSVLIPASIGGGYDAFMDPSVSPVGDELVQHPPAPTHDFGASEVVIYTEPTYPHAHSSLSDVGVEFDTTFPTSLDDYTTVLKPSFAGMDYRRAFQEPPAPPPSEEHEPDLITE
jgi:hypothetical protein